MSGSINYGTLTQGKTVQQIERRSSLPFVTTWMELEIILLSEVSQVVKDKYHIISAYKWNLINKIYKQAKYNQRHWNRQQTDNKQSGGERKLTWESTERVINEHVWRTHGQSQRRVGLRVGGGGGWSEGKWWWENGDNCIRTTIKKW